MEGFSGANTGKFIPRGDIHTFAAISIWIIQRQIRGMEILAKHRPETDASVEKARQHAAKSRLFPGNRRIGLPMHRLSAESYI